MQDVIIEFLKQVNVVQLAAILIAFWFFYSRLDQKIENNKNELKQEIEKNKIELKQEIEKNKNELKQEIEKNKIELKQENVELKRELGELKVEITGKIDKLSEKVEDVDRRLCRIEGSLATHGHCLFNQVQPDRKAE